MKLSQDNNAKRVTRSSQLTTARVRRSAEPSDEHKSDAMYFIFYDDNFKQFDVSQDTFFNEDNNI